MNIALTETEELVNGKRTAEYGDAFVRGNNGPYTLPWPSYSFFLPLTPSTCSSLHHQSVIVASVISVQRVQEK
jgi:hypothetical protein